jgi:hypothetical protein
MVEVNNVVFPVLDLLEYQRKDVRTVSLVPVIKEQVVAIEALDRQAISVGFLKHHFVPWGHIPGENDNIVSLYALSYGKIMDIGLQSSVGLRRELVDDVEDFHGFKVPTSVTHVNT